MEPNAGQTGPGGPQHDRRGARPAAGPPAFVGRAREMEVLLGGLQDAGEGRGRVFLLSGEPGIGKSRLADELSAHGRERGFRVLWGRCWEAGGAPAYWPWVQSLRSYLRQSDPEALIREMGTGAADVARVLPELRDLLPSLPEPPTLDPESARFRLFDATTSFLRNAADSAPVMLVLDDLHAADTPSLLLLEFAAGEMGDARLMLVGTYRDVDPTLDYPLVSTLGQLARRQNTYHVPLGGLNEGEVADLVEATTGVPPQELAVEIHRETEGNPLFVAEVARLLAAEGMAALSGPPGRGRLAVPESVREVIGRRVAGLSEPCRELLGFASVAGREFELDVLEQIAGRPALELMGILEEATISRVIVEMPGGPGLLRFGHALVRDTLYEEISPAQRMELHARIGQILASLPPARSETRLAEIAHHLASAGPAVAPDRVSGYARRAADHAVASLAYEEAVRLYRLALDVLERGGSSEPAFRSELLLRLGDAQARAGDTPGARETFLHAAGVARNAGLSDELARAALGYGGRFVWARAGTDRRLVPLLQEALAALGEHGDASLRVRVMARLAGALRDEPDRRARMSLSERAVELARRSEDPATLAYALDARFAAIWGPDDHDELLRISSELIRSADRAGDKERVMEGHDYRFYVFLVRGDPFGARAELEAMSALAEELRQPAQTWHAVLARTILELAGGRFDEEMIRDAFELGRHAQPWDATAAFRLEMFMLRKEQGRIEEVEDDIRRSVSEYPAYPMFRAALANLYAHMGRDQEARRLLGELSRDGFAAVPRDAEWLFGMCLLAEACVLLGDAGTGSELHQALLPYADLVAASNGEVVAGPAGRYVGMLAALLSRWDEAVHHLERSIQIAERMEMRPWAAHARQDLARVLLGRGGPGDRERAEELLGEALRAAQSMEMSALGASVLALMGEGASIPEEPAEDHRPRGPNIFRREGEYWSIVFEGDSFRLRDTKGLRYLSHLLGASGREVHVLDLVVLEAGVPRHGSRRPRSEPGIDGVAAADAGEVLDPTARAAYRRRIEELQDVLTQAEAFGDAEGGARAQAEMEFLARELAGTTGLGGRGRRLSSAGERARQSVTKAIKAAVTRIARESPALGRHLRSTIRTGTFCSYLPDPRVPPSWQR